MHDSFGTLLRKHRHEAGVGLRALAEMIKKSPGYISDIEKGHVPPPSEAVIIQIATVLGLDKQELLLAAGKMDPEISTYLLQEPGAVNFVRMARDRGFFADDWERLNQLADIARLGNNDQKD